MFLEDDILLQRPKNISMETLSKITLSILGTIDNSRAICEEKAFDYVPDDRYLGDGAPRMTPC